MITGVGIATPVPFKDERGSVMRMLRTDDAGYAGFGEVYFSTVNPGVVKGWKRHREMSMTLACPAGRILVVLFDDRLHSPTQGQFQEVELGPNDYKVLSIPPMVWNAFMGLDPTGPSLLANCASIPHRPDEADRIGLDDPRLAFAWPCVGR